MKIQFKLHENYKQFESTITKKAIRKNENWLLLSKHKRKEQCIQLKNNIRKNKIYYGGLFYTHHYAVNDPRYIPSEYDVQGGYDISKSSWKDIYFLSNKYKDILYNCTIVILKDYINDIVHNYAINIIEQDFSDLLNENQDFKKIIKNKLYFDKLNEILNNLKDYIKYPNDLVISKSHFKYDKDFQYGVGLDIVANCDNLTNENINNAIIAFYGNDEKEWQSENTINILDVPKDYYLYENEIK